MAGSKSRSTRGRPTMNDVASTAGVSQATVSLVLNGSPGAKLSDATRRRVQQAAENLGYHFVKRGSKSAPNDKSTIVFVADEVTTDPWMALAFEGARDKSLEFGINVCLTVSHGDQDIETSIVAQMGGSHILGFIYGTILTRQVQIPPALAEQRLVLVNCYDRERTFPSVLPGDALGGRMATERLIAGGARHIALINGQQGLDASRDRLKGYRQALSSNDIPFDSELVRPGNWEPSSGYEQTLELMKMRQRPDAIFCANDMMALGCMDALRELGLSVPGDVSVIGFDDREIARYTHPPLTTLVLPQYEMGETAAEMLIDSAGGLQSGPNLIKIECPIVERSSVSASGENGLQPQSSRVSRPV